MRNKIILLAICILLVCGCSNYRELDELAIITAIAIDKSDDEYELSFLIANSPKAQTSSKEGEATTTVFSGKGKTLTEAANSVDSKTPKTLYYGHINVAIISEEIAREGFLEIADWLLRSPETRKQFYLMQAKDSDAKDILKIVEPLEATPSQSISSLIESNINSQSITTTISYSPFIERVLEKGYDPILPSVSISGKVKKGSSETNLEKTEPAGYLKLDDTAIFREDKFVGYVGVTDSQSINVLNDSVSELKIDFKYDGNDVVFTSDNIKTTITNESFNHFRVKVKGSGFVSEVNGKIALDEPTVVKKMEKKLESALEKQLNKTLNKLQNEYKCDVVGFGNRLYGKYPKQWDKIEEQWNDEYYPKLKVDITSDLTIESSGSLNRAIEEVRS